MYYVGTASNKFGGLEKFNIELFKKLLREGHEIIVVYRRPILEGPYKKYLDNNSIKYIFVNDSFEIEKESKLRNALQIANIIKHEKPELIHYNFANLYDIALARFLNPFRKYKAFYTAHCHINLRNKYLKSVFTLLSKFVDKIFCVSEAITKEFVENLDSTKATTLYLGVKDNKQNREENRIKLGFRNNEIIIANIAYHDPIKGVDVLIEAIKCLKNKLNAQNFRVIQIGGSPFKNRAQKIFDQLEKSNLGASFEMWGLRNDVDDIMSAIDIYCQPSRSEGIPLSIMEASISGIPVVATKVGGIAEVAKDKVNALLSVSEDYVSIANDLNTLINDTKLREKLGKNGQLIAKEYFDIDRQTEKLLGYYLEE